MRPCRGGSTKAAASPGCNSITVARNGGGVCAVAAVLVGAGAAGGATGGAAAAPRTYSTTFPVKERRGCAAPVPSRPVPSPCLLCCPPVFFLYSAPFLDICKELFSA